MSDNSNLNESGKKILWAALVPSVICCFGFLSLFLSQWFIAGATDDPDRSARLGVIIDSYIGLPILLVSILSGIIGLLFLVINLIWNRSRLNSFLGGVVVIINMLLALVVSAFVGLLLA